MQLPSLTLASAILICGTVCSFADLKFESKSVELKAQASDEKLPAEFKFKNTGDSPIEITEIDITCSCLSAKTDKKVYKPGEVGTVSAVFKLGTFTGHQKKALTVVAGSQRVRLEVGVQIPNVLTITPNVVEWSVGDEPEPKTFKVTVEHVDPINITKVVSSRDGFPHELKTIKEGREYELTITPESTDAAMLGMLRLYTDCEIKKHQIKMAFFSITKPKAKKKPVCE